MSTNNRKLDSREFSQQAFKSLNVLKNKLKPLAKEVLMKEAKRFNRPDPTEEEIKKKAQSYCEKSSGLVQSLSGYIAAWGLHRLSGDARKFSMGTSEDNQYKGEVYGLFLEHLRCFSHTHNEDLNFVLWSASNTGEDEISLVNMPLRKYTVLNRLAIQLAKEWSFWATAVLGEPKE